MRWNVVLGLIFLGVALPGCTRTCYVTEYDSHQYNRLMPDFMERRADAGLPITPAHSPAPADVNNLERERRYLSLAEAIAAALENGTTGVQSVVSPGAIQQDLLTAGQLIGLGTQSDSNRVLSLNPAIAGAAIEAAVSRFDVLSTTNFSERTTDEPINGFTSLQNGESAHLESSLVKPLASGGVAGITFSTDYTLLSAPPAGIPITNPAYTPRLIFTFDQPLLQNFGTEINQLLPLGPTVSPGSTLSTFAQSYLGNHGGLLEGLTGISTPGILVARVRFDQTRADFERAVNFKLYNVETAYWNLYAAYVSLYASEQGMRQAHQAWLETQLRFAAGSVSEAEVAVALGQYEQFRGDRIQAVAQVLEAERTLRVLMGLPADDGKQLVPADAPTVAPYLPDWDTALNEALLLRPELVAARQEIKARQFNVLVQQNYLKPDFRFTSAYEVVGLGTTLTGDGTLPGSAAAGMPVTSNALRSLTGGHFADWNLGFTLNMPLGYRFEHAAVRQAKLALAQGHLALQREETKARDFLTKAYRDVLANYSVIEARRAQRLAYAKQVEAEYQLVRLGKVTVRFLLQAEQAFAAALASEAQAIVAYNNSLAEFEFAKGTIMRHDNVQISEGPLPQCAQVRAVEHEKERTKALVLRERANPIHEAPISLGNSTTGVPELPAHEMPALPSLLDSQPDAKAPAAASPPAAPAAAAPPAAPATSPAQAPAVPAVQAAPVVPPVQAAPAELPAHNPPVLPELPSAPELPQTQAAPRPAAAGLQEASFRQLTPLPTSTTDVPAPPGMPPGFQWQSDPR
jgi:outer membrane protein TolC